MNYFILLIQINFLTLTSIYQICLFNQLQCKMQQKYQQKPPNIVESLSRAFLQKQNTLLIHSKGLDVLRALAQSLYLQKLHLVILVDFEYAQIQELNYYLQQIKQQHLILNKQIRSDKPQVVPLNKVVRQRRKKYYILGGIYSLSTQVMLLDCLSDTQDLSPQLISRVIIKDSDYVISDQFSLVVWLATLISLHDNKIMITAVSRKVSQFKNDNLQKIYRLLYMKKLVLWPFGRSQIHKALQKKSLANRNHKLTFNTLEEELHKNYMQLLRYCEKSVYDKNQVQYLCYCLVNCCKLDYLVKLQNIVLNGAQFGIWKSSNTNVIQIIDKIVQISRKCIYGLLLMDVNKQDVRDKTGRESGQQSRAGKEVEQYGRSLDLNYLINGIQNNQNNSQICELNIDSMLNGPPQLKLVNKNREKDNSQPNLSSTEQLNTNTINPGGRDQCRYSLSYQLNISGVNSQQCGIMSKCPLFPAKMIQILRQIHESWGSINAEEKQMQEQDQMEQISMIEDKSKLKVSSCQNIAQSHQSPHHNGDNQYQAQKQKVRNQPQQNKAEQDNNKQQQITDREPDDQIDLSAYQYRIGQASNINSQNQSLKENIPKVSSDLSKLNSPFSDSSTLNKIANQRVGNQQYSCRQSMGQQKQESQLKMDSSKLSQTMNNRISLRSNYKSQIVVYICTASKQVSKQLHYSIFCYEHQFYYIAYIRKLYAYLHLKLEQRITAIKRIIKRQSNLNNGSRGGNGYHKQKLILEEQPILLQQLYIELRAANQLIEKYSQLRQDTIQAEYLFKKQLQRLQFRYIRKQLLKLWSRDYSLMDDCIVTYHGCKIRFCIQTNASIPQLNENLRILTPSNIFLYSPNTSYIRHLNIAFSQEHLFGIDQLHTIYFNNSLQSDKIIKAVKQEDQAFWVIAQQRKKLGQYKQNACVRIKQLLIDDQISKKARMMSLAAQTQLKNSQHINQIKKLPKFSLYNSIKLERVILVDKRQFKSLLPSYLYHHGFKVIPIFLQNGDYILSNQVCIQKKSVHTRDLHESLKSGRINQQIKRMCAKFTKPYLLIQCPDISYFKKQQFKYGYSRSGGKYSQNIRKQLIQLISKNPKINLLWSTSYMQTVKYMIQLKKNREQPDISKFRPQSQSQGQLQAKQIQILQQDQMAHKSQNKQEILQVY